MYELSNTLAWNNDDNASLYITQYLRTKPGAEGRPPKGCVVYHRYVDGCKPVMAY